MSTQIHAGTTAAIAILAFVMGFFLAARLSERVDHRTVQSGFFTHHGEVYRLEQIKP